MLCNAEIHLQVYSMYKCNVMQPITVASSCGTPIAECYINRYFVNQGIGVIIDVISYTPKLR